MINFTVGPVQSSEQVREIAKDNTPYFRTPEFSEVMLENEKLMIEFANAPAGSRTVFITGSGTASMEAAIINTLDENDKAIVVKGGSFGERFVEMCQIHKIPHDVIELEHGTPLKAADLEPFENKGYTTFIVNLHETSTGVLYDIDLISDFCRRNNLFLIVDAISAFIADPIDMTKSDIGLIITGSQKALAVPPGISIIVLSPKAVKRVEEHDSKCMYLDLKLALVNGERGQTPFTPAVTTLLQINRRLKEIEENGGIEAERKKINALANDFRERIKEFPFDFFSQSESNAVTSLFTNGISAKNIFTTLKDEYGIWICPNGGDLAETVFRVGHIGNLTIEDNTALIEALQDMKQRGLLG